jgi:hypothetical protein
VRLSARGERFFARCARVSRGARDAAGYNVVMFRTGALLLLVMMFAAGCAARRERCDRCGPRESRRPAPQSGNLVFGPSAEYTALGEALAARSSWPSVDTGYLLEDATYFEHVSIDDQSFYDCLGGAHIDERVTVRSGLFVR